ncbi:hypothetical protein BBU64B_F0030 (plasmid) [Borreliella burgdorferi 64b]|nr:hypothetical protein BBU64B_F0030 [Borreliella burgdorferi 64b]
MFQMHESLKVFSYDISFFDFNKNFVFVCFDFFVFFFKFF